MTTPRAAAAKPRSPRASAASSASSARGFAHDWQTMLTPIFITVGLSVIANVASSIWQGATFKSQVVQMEAHEKEQDATINESAKALQALLTRLPIDYMPRVESDRSREITKEMRDLENERIAKIEENVSKTQENVAKILQNQSRK